MQDFVIGPKVIRVGLLASVLATLVTGVFAAEPVVLNGAGSTFSAPLYTEWFKTYHVRHPEIEVTYQAVGSGAGVKQITEKTVDFGASDAPLSDEEAAKAPGILHIPTELGAVVVTYNLPGLEGLKLSPQTVIGIFSGQIKAWNDSAILADNPKLQLPKVPIAVVHRSDGSGTTYVFTDYLSAISPVWKKSVGKGKTVNWPVGVGAKGNDGCVAEELRQRGAVTYVELGYALQNKMGIAILRNHEGEWIDATPAAVQQAAAAMAGSLPTDLRTSIVDAPGKLSWPISAFSYALIYKEQSDATRGRALVELFWWAIHDGQKINEVLSYASLPPEVVKLTEAKLKLVQHDGKALLPASQL